MTALNLIKNMTKRGNAIVGVGCFAAALESSTSVDKIIKIGNNLDDKWLDYYGDVCLKYPDAQAIPRIHSFYQDAEHQYYVCVMERLHYYTDERTNDAKQLVRRYIEGGINKNDWIDAAVDYPKQFGHLGQFLQIMDAIRDGSDLDDECCEYDDLYNYRRIDLHNANILSRVDGQLVITDPWCAHSSIMCDVDALDDWADKTLGFYAM